MVYQRHVDGFLVFPVRDVWFNLLRFIPTYFVAFLVCMLWANFDFSNRPCVLLNAYF
jgi:hypothetical protein